MQEGKMSWGSNEILLHQTAFWGVTAGCAAAFLPGWLKAKHCQCLLETRGKELAPKPIK